MHFRSITPVSIFSHNAVTGIYRVMVESLKKNNHNFPPANYRVKYSHQNFRFRLAGAHLCILYITWYNHNFENTMSDTVRIACMIKKRN